MWIAVLKEDSLIMLMIIDAPGRWSCDALYARLRDVMRLRLIAATPAFPRLMALSDPF